MRGIIKIYESDVIAAPATPPGKSALAMIRMSGEGVLEVMKKCLVKNGDKLEPRRATLVEIGDKSEAFDQAIAIFYRAPNTYTGEDMIEICCHGGDYIRNKVTNLLWAKGARPAEPGEFTLRAFLNGKKDLAQAEAVAELIEAESDAARRNALEQLHGGLSKRVNGIRNALMDMLSEIEAEIEFPDDEPESVDFKAWKIQLEESIKSVDEIISMHSENKALREGFKVVIAGPPNSGKSTLLNRLLGVERAIVHSLAGTTRDLVRSSVEIGGIKIWITDTAGLRESKSPIEKEGVNRAITEMETSDLVLYLFDLKERNDTSISLMEDKYNDALIVGNKVDLYKEDGIKCDLKISALRGDGVEQLMNLIKGKAVKCESNSVVVVNQRHLECLMKAKNAMKAALVRAECEKDMELLAFEMKAAASALGNITGEEVTEEVLSRIFSKFCIGK